jgi:hypothetical protein
VDTVLVDGKVLVQGGRALSIDEEEVYKEVKRLKKGILQKTGLLEKIKPKWPIA